MTTRQDFSSLEPVRGDETLVSLENVSKIFPNGTTALRDMTLEVRQGEFVTLLGPSGCGKTTVLRLIAALAEPSSGRIDWHGAAGAHDHGIGFVFQEPTLMPWASVFKNVWLPLRLSGIAGDSVRHDIMAALEMVGLDGFADTYPRELSGGMKMRVSIARALVTRPKLLLMDEPFAALDEITRFRLNDDLLDLWKRFGWTIVFVTHSVFEAVYLSNRIAVMTPRPGRVFRDIRTDAPYPRDDSFRTSPVYAEYCREVSTALHSAMESLEPV